MKKSDMTMSISVDREITPEILDKSEILYAGKKKHPPVSQSEDALCSMKKMYILSVVKCSSGSGNRLDKSEILYAGKRISREKYAALSPEIKKTAFVITETDNDNY